MRRILYTTTEYTTRLVDCINPDSSRPDAILGENFYFFLTKKAAKKDAEFLKRQSSVSAKRYGGPKVVKITFEVLE